MAERGLSLLAAWGLAFLMILQCSTVSAQLKPVGTAYAVQLGVFKSPDRNRYNTLADLGQIDWEPMPQGTHKVRLGYFPTRYQADSVLFIVKRRGFKDAFVVERQQSSQWDSRGVLSASSVSANANLYSVQVGVFSQRELAPPIEKLQSLGTFYELETGDKLKLRVGSFGSREEAERQLIAIRNMGYKDAFICEISPTIASRELATRNTLGHNFQTASTYKRMEGTLNDEHPLVMHTYLSGNSLNGYYTDPQTGNQRELVYYDLKQSSSATTLEPATMPGNNFRLDFSARDKINNKALNFKLKERYDAGSARVDVVSIYRKKIRDGSGGEMGADLYVEYPRITAGPPESVLRKINRALLPFPEASNAPALDAMINQQLDKRIFNLGSYLPEFKWATETIENKILENDKGLLSIRMIKELVIENSEYQVNHKSFELAGGSELKLNEQLSYGYASALKNMLRRKIGQQYGYLRPSLPDVDSSIEELLSNYYFTKAGIVFYRQYRGWSSIKEPLEVTLTYQELRPLIKPGSFISKF